VAMPPIILMCPPLQSCFPQWKFSSLKCIAIVFKLDCVFPHFLMALPHDGIFQGKCLYTIVQANSHYLIFMLTCKYSNSVICLYDTDIPTTDPSFVISRLKPNGAKCLFDKERKINGKTCNLRNFHFHNLHNFHD
jgi:hypothetical protein